MGAPATPQPVITAGAGGRPRSRLSMIALRFRDALLVLFLVLLVVFFLGTILGRPEEELAPMDASQEQIDEIRSRLGRDRPVIVQLGTYLKNLTQGDMGESLVIARGESALGLIRDRLPATPKLTLASILVAGFVGVGFGVIAGVRPGSVFDRIATTFGMTFVSFPYFWFGLIMIIVFAVNLKLVPVLADDRQLQSYFLPAATLGLYHGGRLFQLVRSATYDEMQKSYITVATSKGLSGYAVILKHVLRNIGVVLVTMVGWEYARMWGGTVFLAEFTFAWPGIGKLVTDAAHRNDFRVIEAGVVVAGVFVVVANLLVDILYTAIDKRVEVS